MHELSHIGNLKSKKLDEDFTQNYQVNSSRKVFLRFLTQSIVGLTVASVPNSPIQMNNNVANAACLSGDTSTDCIGFYKVPMDDAVLPYIATPEKLEKFAPGIRWVPPVPIPKNYRDAVNEIRILQKEVENLRNIVLKGNLEEAGVNILGIVPKITVAGRVVIAALYSAGFTIETKSEDGNQRKSDVSMRAYRVENAFQNVQCKLGECDIMIGQGMRGEMGSLTAAQIGILETIDEANADLAELINAIPEGFDPDSRKKKK